MPVIYRASLSYLLRHPWQLTLAVVGICIGVAVIVAVDLANSSARKAFLLSMDAITGVATHQVIGGPAGLDETLYRELRVARGLTNIAPVVEGYGDAPSGPVRIFGVDVFAERAMERFADLDSVATDDDPTSLIGDLLTEPGAALVSEATAAALGLRRGDMIELVTAGRVHAARIIGIFESTGGAADDVLLTDVATAQVWLNQPGRLTRIDARLGDHPDAVARFQEILPAGTRLLSAAGRTRATTEMSTAFMTNLTAMSLLALLVGLFLIYNSVSFSVLQRRGLIGVLRALGITRRQAFTLVVVESAGIGLIASVIGVLVGIGLGERLLVLVSQSINDLYFRVNVTAVDVSGLSITKGMLAGIAASTLAAAVPAFEAAAYPPRLALLRSTVEHRARHLVPLIAGLGVLTLLVAAATLWSSARSLVAGLAAVFLVIFGFAMCIPLAVRGLAILFERPGRHLAGLPGAMAISGIATSLSRTGVAIVALAVAVSATIGVSVMVDSFRGSVSAWLERSLQADVYVGAQGGPLDPEVIADLAALPGVAHVSSSRRARFEYTGGQTDVLAIDMAPGSYAGTEIIDSLDVDVWRAFDAGDAVLVSEPYAYQHEVAPGDTITLPTTSGDRIFPIVAIYQSYDVSASAILMSRDTYDRYWDDTAIDSIGLYLDEGANADAIIAMATAIAANRQALRARSNSDIRVLSLEIFDRTFIITDVLYWLATGVALIGILSAMLALQLERARDLAVLRALGMTPAELGGMITLQTGAIGLFSGLAALPLGVAMAYILIDVINRRAFGWQIDMDVGAGVLVSAVLFAVLAAVVAGLYPAWRAANSRPALAMREE